MKRCYACFQTYKDEYEICPFCGQEELHEPAEPIQLMPGTLLLGRYEIGLAVGAGGFGIVYKAWDQKLETVVAVKEFFPVRLASRAPGTNQVTISEKSEDEFAFRKKRFLEEARTMAMFSDHPYIPNVYAFFEENETAYIVMEFLTGMTLNRYMEVNHGHVETAFALEVADQTGQALAALHEKGVIHCDVAPDNIFICDGEQTRVKLMDLGAARLADGSREVSDIILKPGYTPAEQYDRSRRIGPWSDVYALSATLYMMLSGIKPEESTNRKIQDTVRPLTEMNAFVSENLSNAVMRGMAVDLHLRYRSMDAFLEALHSEKQVLSPEQEKKKRRRRRLYGMTAAFVILAVVAVILLRKFEDKREEGYLDAAVLEIWFAAEEGSDKEAALRYITDDFTANFPDIVILLKAIPEEEYAETVRAAAAAGNLPPLFESTLLEESDLAAAIDLQEVLGSEQAKACFFLNQYQNSYDTFKKIPLGIEVPVAYVITSGNVQTDYEGAYFHTLSDFGVDTGSVSADSACQGLIDANFAVPAMAEGQSAAGQPDTLGEPAVSESTAFAGEDAFLSEEGNTSPVLLSSTMQLNTFRKAHTDYMKACVYYQAPEIICGYTYEWSIGRGSKAQETAAKRLLSWMLGNAYQSALMITMCSDGPIPVNEVCFHAKLESRYLAPIEQIYKQFVFH